MNNIPLQRENFGTGWRWLTVISGLLLAATFFVPVTGSLIGIWTQIGPTTFGMTSIGTVDAPYLLWSSLIRRLVSIPLVWAWWASNIPDCVGFIVFLGLPYFWGLLMALYSLFEICGKTRAVHIVSITGLTVSSMVLIAVAALLIMRLPLILPLANSNLIQNVARMNQLGMRASAFDIYIVIMAVIVCLSLYAILAARKDPWAYLYHSFLAALVCFVILIFGYLVQGYRYTYFEGREVGFIAGSLLLLSRLGEAHIVSRISWLNTLLGLLTLRLERIALPPGHCPGCRYNLLGVSTYRCPECGRAFDLREIGLIR